MIPPEIKVGEGFAVELHDVASFDLAGGTENTGKETIILHLSPGVLEDPRAMTFGLSYEQGAVLHHALGECLAEYAKRKGS